MQIYANEDLRSYVRGVTAGSGWLVFFSFSQRRAFYDTDNDEGNVSRLAKAKASVKGWLLSGVSAQSSPRTHTDPTKSIRTTVDVPARYTSVYLETRRLENLSEYSILGNRLY